MTVKVENPRLLNMVTDLSAMELFNVESALVLAIGAIKTRVESLGHSLTSCDTRSLMARADEFSKLVLIQKQNSQTLRKIRDIRKYKELRGEV